MLNNYDNWKTSEPEYLTEEEENEEEENYLAMQDFEMDYLNENGD